MKLKYLKLFIILIIIGTIFGALYGRIDSVRMEKNLKNSTIVYTSISDSINLTIIAIENEKYSDEYIKALKENILSVDFPFFRIKKGEKLYVLDKISSDLYKVALVTYSPTRIRASYLECYIWTGFLEDGENVVK